MTFSIVARCRDTGMFGIAICSSSPAVAARCVHVQAGVGAVASQNITDPRLGQRGLLLASAGHSAVEALRILIGDNTYSEYRQVAMVDARGQSAIHSGRHCLGINASRHGPDYATAGNLLASKEVPGAMADAFASHAAEVLPERLVRCLEAGLAAGGEAGPVKSAGLAVVDNVTWPVVDLRVDWADEPVTALRGLWELWRPQMADYVKRALDPAAAPSYGVPGDP
jgi:uncharacterized Ntn-hydrolase superfamily protein